ncbi:MAG TPA: hypothetical protein H9950_06610 [Candidatus Bacteroides avicola]|uniref:Outer membrane protein n=1 Tax=Candidatus Bacteroides avicola TaxID=2838468 RepID=A0A9D2KV95_9BACE|nr:hypothetical protein [Mediterranea sp. An20]MBW9203185.1 hypothetical protein [Bacteroidales bacterium SW292]OUP08826.1 hypothetical protein B5F34_08145 [Mediterranea sp. An20]HJA85848.1 hypothetical protein [Candidatus Bacteroides avicola]
MIKFRHTLLALLLTMLSGVAVAQNNTNSPYTRYGYGQLADPGSANSKAMGGVAYALRDKSQVNFANPASYSSVDSLTFIFDGGISLQNTNFSNGTTKLNARNSSFDYVTMQFRAAKWAGISLGLLPYANVGYNLSEFRENEESQTASSIVQYDGDGGIHLLYLGAGFKLWKNLSVGANVSYLWGGVTRTRTLSFPYDSEIFASVVTSMVDVKSYKLDFGLQYTQDFGKKHALTLGVVFSPGHNLNATATEYRQTGTDENATVSETDLPSGFGIPTTWGGGLAYVYDRRLTLAADVMLQNWQDVSYLGEKNVFCKRGKISLGAEFIPSFFSRSFFGHVKYRAGFYYSRPYYKINDMRAAKEFGVTAGFGFPVPRTRSLVSVSAQYVRTKGTTASFLDENTLRLCIGITFNERWFFKNRVD